MSNLSELLPAGAGAKSAEFVASGTLGSGVTVALKSDGTVSAVASSPEGEGTIANLSANPTFMVSVYDPVNNKVVIIYSDPSSTAGKAVVATVSGQSISFGTPVTFNAGQTYYSDAVYDAASGNIVIVFADNGNSDYPTVIVGSVSGTSISFGSEVVLKSEATAELSIGYDTVNEKVAMVYPRLTTKGCGIRAGTVSGTSITLGSEFSAGTSDNRYTQTVYHEADGYFLSCMKEGSAEIRTKTFQISGTSISYGDDAAFAESPLGIRATYDPVNEQVVMVYADNGNSNYGTATAIYLIGEIPYYGTRYIYSSSATTQNSSGISYDINGSKLIISYSNSGSSYDCEVKVATASGTVLSFGSAYTIETGITSYYNYCTYNSVEKQTIVTYRESVAPAGRAVAFQLDLTNSGDFIGITDQAIADTATGAVIVQGGVASGVTLPYYYSFGTGVVFDNQLYTDGLTSTYDSNSNKVVISYSDSGNSGYATAIVGTVSGSDISFGTPVVAASTNALWFASTFDSSANKVVVAYRSGANPGEAVVGTVSGTSISFGSAAQFEPGRNAYTVATFDSSNNKVIIAYQDDLNSNYGTIVVGTVSGTSISFGSPIVFNSATTYYLALTFDSNEGKVVLGYRDGSNGNAGTALIGTVSGTSISFGSSAVFQSGTTSWIAATFDSNSNKVLFTYNNSTAGKVAVGTVSGTSISFGTPVTFDAGNSNQFVTTFDSNLNQVFIVYRDQSNLTYGTIIAATISGTTATFSDAEVFATVTVNVPQIVFDSNANKTVVSYVDTAATGSGTSIVTNLTNTLAVASDYYVQSDGSLSTTVSSVPAGRALSSTSILLEG